MRPLLFLLFAFLPLAHAAEDVTVSIDLSDTGSAHVVIESPAQSSEDLKPLLRDPAIRNIYGERLSSVFAGIENLDLRVSGDLFIIEFDSTLTSKTDVWTTASADFTGVLTTPSSLTITLPENTQLVSASPPPSEISGTALTWNNPSSPTLLYVLLLGGAVLVLVLLRKTRLRGS